jgi:Cro/C1-type HTH DNA-binding domain
VGITLANLSVLKNGRARAVRFTTLTALCDVLECQPGDLLSVPAAVALSEADSGGPAAAGTAPDGSAPDEADSGGADPGQRNALTRR